ncbi:MAG: glycosyltransferase family 4 protein [Gammaproteobacteria bacterium]|nr:glycosyltransferase family 4 protein [Gammaproteobacteria bacterium]
MRILLVHNYYRAGAPGGEDVVFRQERDLLSEAGHEVTCFTRSNDEMDEHRFADRLRVVWDLRHSRRTFRELGAVIRRVQPDVVHFHNTFPLISASGYAACATAGVPIVQTIHNFRLVCSAATHFRAGAACERCTAVNPWPAVRHGCYRGSRLASFVVASMLYRNQRARVRQDPVDMYLALTPFAARRLMAAGIPKDRVTVKPNFVELSDDVGKTVAREDRFVFVGRLAEEKGVRFLLAAWRGLRDMPLLLVGEGPLRVELEAYVREHSLPVEFAGLLDRTAVREVIRSARAVIVPSLCFEGGVPLSLLEAMSSGTPVIASRLGGVPELVTDGVDGLLFEPGDAAQLVRQARRLISDPIMQSSLAQRALQAVSRVHGKRANLDALLRVYTTVCRARIAR